MYSNSKLAKSVRLALLVGAASTALTGVSMAQQSQESNESAEEERFERIHITGSRLTRSDMEGATPVTVINREDIDATGFQSVSDVLRNNSFNVSGSFRENSGNTWQGQSNVNMRGLGASRTLVLLNGRRMPASPVMGGQIQNLNSVPFAAVERIEILSDGASAMYGSDAIGGVINIILREGFEGAELTVSQTKSEQPGGDEKAVSAIGGAYGDRGQVTWVLEHDSKDIIFSRDRHFFRSNDFNTPGDEYFPDINQTVGYSMAARNIMREDFSVVSMVDQDCSVYGDDFVGVFQDSYYPGDTLCAYDYTGTMGESASLNRYSFFMDSSYEIDHDHNFFARALSARTKSFGRYAPAAGSFRWRGPKLEEEQLPGGQTMAELNPGDLILYRFDITGPARDTTQVDNLLDISLGFEGFISGLDIDYEVAYTRSIYEMHEWGDGYVNVQGLNAAAQGGWDPRNPDQSQYQHLVDAMTENSNRRSHMIVDRYDIGIQGEGPWNSMYYLGAEARNEQYKDQSQAQLEAGLVLGSSGGSSGGSREMKAVFSEFTFPVTDTLDIDLAARLDNYSDFGSAASWKVASRWQPSRDFVLRASAGTGFRAPSLDTLFQQPSQSFVRARDITECMGGTISQVRNSPTFAEDMSACLAAPPREHETFFSANPDLDAEKSLQYAVGAVFDFSDRYGINLNTSVDYYNTEIKDTITSIGTQSVLWLHFMETIDQFVGVEYNNPQGGNPHVAQPTNYTSFTTSGLDFSANWYQDFSWGRLSAKGTMSYVLEYNRQFTPGSELQDYTKLNQNKYRADITLGYAYNNHSLNWHTYFIPERCHGVTLDMDTVENATFLARCTTDADGQKRKVDSWNHSSVNYSYDTSWDGKFTLGISNVFDREPPLDQNLAFDTTLYPYVGRQYTARYTQRF